MPPFKQPETLYGLSLECVSKAVGRACDNIQQIHGNYDRPECKAAVRLLQSELLSNIPSVLMDKLFQILAFQCTDGDGRIRLAVCMHPGMQRFTGVNGECRAGLHEFFQCHLAELHKLVDLDLHLACTDEILKIVSENCPLLEDINIVSKVENCRSKTAANFNALRLKLFVSDIGLGYLLKCQKLKRITTNRILRSNCGGRMITHDGLRTLLRGLPNLECLHYEDLGSVIASGMSDIGQLALTNFHDNHPCQRNIEEAARLCRHLTHVYLCLPYGEELRNRNSYHRTEEVARSLAESSIFPSVLEIQNIHYSDAVRNMLQVKGSLLTSLLLHTENYIGVTELFLIGDVSLNLEKLHITGLGSSFVKDSANKWLASVSRGRPIYKNLKCLSLAGQEWKPKLVLNLFMATASGLTSLSVWNYTGIMFRLPTTLDDFVKKHRFPQLQTAYFGTRCLLSKEAVHCFVHKCPNLESLILFEHDGLKSQDIEELQKEANSKNLYFNVVVGTY